MCWGKRQPFEPGASRRRREPQMCRSVGGWLVLLWIVIKVAVSGHRLLKFVWYDCGIVWKSLALGFEPVTSYFKLYTSVSPISILIFNKTTSTNFTLRHINYSRNCCFVSWNIASFVRFLARSITYILTLFAVRQSGYTRNPFTTSEIRLFITIWMESDIYAIDRLCQ